MSTAHVIRQMLVDLELASNDVSQEWFAYVGFFADRPDSALCVYDTQGRGDGRLMKTGEQIIHPGIQIMVRGMDYLVTRKRVEDISLKLDEQRKTLVALESSASYIIHNVSRTGDIMSLGLEPEGDRRRHFFTVNALVTIERLN